VITHFDSFLGALSWRPSFCSKSTLPRFHDRLSTLPITGICEDGKAPFGSRRPIAFAHNRNPNQKESVHMRNTAAPFWKKFDRLKVGLSAASPQYPAVFKLATAASQASTSAAN
jgi:hypothetical protein